MRKHLAPATIEQAEAERRSVLTFADRLCKTTPLLVMHGTGDRRVAAEHSIMLALELQRLQHPYKLVMYDNADHVLAGRRRESNADIRWWMDHYVRDKAPLPRTGPHGA
jgi:dipeptidyl aminopeptidase/acylaminoacyl peptidase